MQQQFCGFTKLHFIIFTDMQAFLIQDTVTVQIQHAFIIENAIYYVMTSIYFILLQDISYMSEHTVICYGRRQTSFGQQEIVHNCLSYCTL